MSSSPRGPGEAMQSGKRPHADQIPEESSHFGHTEAAPSQAGQARLSLERRERTRVMVQQRLVCPFFSLLLTMLWLLVCALGSQHREEGLRQHAEGDMYVLRNRIYSKERPFFRISRSFLSGLQIY